MIADEVLRMKNGRENSFLILKLFNLIILISFLVFSNFPSFAQNNQNKKTILVQHGGVSSDDILASNVGVEILKNGGNAADAATAVAMALAVVYPQAGNLGGGGFLIHRSSDGEVFVLDFREIAPQKAHPKMYLNVKGDLIPESSLIGGLAVGVPGTVKGVYRYHQKYGNLPWYQVLEPAVKLAEDGFVIGKFLADRLKENEKYFKRFSPTSLIFMPKGKTLEAGDKLYQKNLAQTLREIALHGDVVFYKGEIGKEIAKTVRKHGGILSFDDLRSYQTIKREPIIIEYRDYTIYAVPPPSSGGIVINAILNSLKKLELNKYALNSAEYISLLSELEKLFFAFRNQYLGDPDFVEMPLEKLLSPAFAERVAKTIRIGHPKPALELSIIEYLGQESEETTHFSVIDSAQNAISVTYTLNANFGCKLVAGSTGILLNNEMDDFSAKPGSPNIYGLVQGEPNMIVPGKRMLSSMCPIIVTRDDKLVGVLGSPGGPMIITAILQTLLNLIDHHMSLDQAIATGRFHHQWLPDSIYYEKGKLNLGELKRLEQMGYGLVKRNHLGDVQAIWQSENGWQISSDPRGNGYPSGY